MSVVGRRVQLRTTPGPRRQTRRSTRWTQPPADRHTHRSCRPARREVRHRSRRGSPGRHVRHRARRAQLRDRHAHCRPGTVVDGRPRSRRRSATDSAETCRSRGEGMTLGHVRSWLYGPLRASTSVSTFAIGGPGRARPEHDATRRSTRAGQHRATRAVGGTDPLHRRAPPSSCACRRRACWWSRGRARGRRGRCRHCGARTRGAPPGPRATHGWGEAITHGHH